MDLKKLVCRLSTAFIWLGRGDMWERLVNTATTAKRVSFSDLAHNYNWRNFISLTCI
jgi:hypothetical protein